MPPAGEAAQLGEGADGLEPLSVEIEEPVLDQRGGADPAAGEAPDSASALSFALCSRKGGRSRMPSSTRPLRTKISVAVSGSMRVRLRSRRSISRPKSSFRCLQRAAARFSLQKGSEWESWSRSPATSSIQATSIRAAVRAKSRLVSIHSPQTIQSGAEVRGGFGFAPLA